MKKFRPRVHHLLMVGIALSGLCLMSCGSQTGSIEKTDYKAGLTGTWILTSRVTGEEASPVTERCMKLVLNRDGTFLADYRGDETQNWIRAGQGGFSYEPPLLTLFWESGSGVTLLVREAEPERLLIHHGRSLVPLKDQEPDEIFVRQKIEKGPTRRPS